MAGQHPEQEQGYTPSRTSLVLPIPPRTHHSSSMSELVHGHTLYPPTGGRRTGEQETTSLHKGEMYVMVWGDEIRRRSYQEAEK